MNKLTDTEIVKALECCNGFEGCPDECPYHSNEFEMKMDCLDEKEGIMAKVEELVSDDFTCFKNKADFNKTIDDLITEIHCLDAKCRKLEKENEDLKISIEVRDDFINRQNEEIKRLENKYIFERR